MRGRKIAFKSKDILTENKTVAIFSCCVIFQNIGEVPILIDSHWEIPSGATFTFGSTSDLDTVIDQTFDIRFKGTSPGVNGAEGPEGIKKLQIGVVEVFS